MSSRTGPCSGKASSTSLSSCIGCSSLLNHDCLQLYCTCHHLDAKRVCRLQCNQLGLFHCRLTGLQLEGVGDLLYQLVPWDLDFLSSKGLRPAGPLFRFTLLSGRFHRLHLPHCQLLPGQRRYCTQKQVVDSAALTLVRVFYRDRSALPVCGTCKRGESGLNRTFPRDREPRDHRRVWLLLFWAGDEDEEQRCDQGSGGGFL